MTDAAIWLLDHIYVPIVVGIAVLLGLMGIICCICWRRRFKRSYYVYKRLEHEEEVAMQMERDRESQQNVIRDTAYLSCQYYMRSHPNYKGLQQLKDIGSRIDKYWFLVADIRTDEEHILSCMQLNSKMSIPFTKITSKTLKDLFTLLKHPHIFPVADFDFSVEQNQIYVFQLASQRGSLKDVIYHSRYSDSWYSKYSQRSRGLPLDNIKKYGKQVLNGMLYLEEKGYPPHGNIHSGNIMVVDDICRIAGYENSFLANTSRVYPLVKKKLKDKSKSLLDSLCFGHMLYEMAFGYELASAHPEPQHLIGHQSPDIVEILNFIFENESGTYPTVQQIADHKFFRSVSLPEMAKYNPVKVHMNEPMKALLKAVRKGKPLKIRKLSSAKKRRSSSQTSPPATPMSPSSSLSATAPHMYSSSNIQVPPPPPPPVLPAQILPAAESTERQALLGDIRKGSRLKRTVTNDRSAPRV